jgi:hypothetical protein
VATWASTFFSKMARDAGLKVSDMEILLGAGTSRPLKCGLDVIGL